MREIINIYYRSGAFGKRRKIESYDSDNSSESDSDESSDSKDYENQAKKTRNTEGSAASMKLDLDFDGLNIGTPPPKERHERAMNHFIGRLKVMFPRSSIYKHNIMGILGVVTLDEYGNEKLMQYQVTQDYTMEEIQSYVTDLSEFTLVHEPEPSDSSAGPSSSSADSQEPVPHDPPGPSNSSGDPPEPGSGSSNNSAVRRLRF